MKKYPYQIDFTGIESVEVDGVEFSPLEVAYAIYYSCKERITPSRDEVGAVSSKELKHLLYAFDKGAAEKDAFCIYLLEKAKKVQKVEYLTLNVTEEGGTMWYGEGAAGKLIGFLEKMGMEKVRAQKYASIFIRFIKNTDSGNDAYPVKLLDDVVILVAKTPEAYAAINRAISSNVRYVDF